jgi:hypothetical protein
MTSLGTLGKLTGKVKYFLAIMFAVVVFLNRRYQLGLTEEEIGNVMIVFLAALGIDGVEGAVATLKNGKKEKPSDDDDG